MSIPYALGTSITIFVVITLIFFALKTNWEKSVGGGGRVQALQGIYFILILILQYVWNFSNAAYICGSAQSYLNVLLYTLLPNFFIFATVVVIITVMPGWLSPFSNTIGYGFVYCMGLTKTFNDLLAPKGNALVTKICSDVSILINEMTVENYDKFMETLYNKDPTKSVLRPGYNKGENEAEYKKLFHLVAMKQSIAEMIWYIFAGCLVISISFNSIQDMACTFTTSQMRDMHSEMKLQAKEQNKQQKAPVLYSKHT